MSGIRQERRKYERYDTQAKVYFQVTYNIKTKVDFQVMHKYNERDLSRKYPGVVMNISVEGLRFSSNKKLKEGNNLYLEVYLPKQQEPICMIGETRWSKQLSDYPRGEYKFDTGVKLINVSGKPVAKTIHFDKKNHIFWSVVLESVFGNFRKFMQAQRHK